jgi:hypothetical protein
VEEAARVLACAHTEARSVPGGIGLVKLMGRHAGFVTAGAAVASQDVDFALIPEVPLQLDAFLAALQKRMKTTSHAVVAVAEGVGQDLIDGDPSARDASATPSSRTSVPSCARRSSRSSTPRNAGRAPLLRPQLPSPQRAANCEDAILCDLFARQRRSRRDGRPKPASSSAFSTSDSFTFRSNCSQVAGNPWTQPARYGTASSLPRANPKNYELRRGAISAGSDVGRRRLETSPYTPGTRRASHYSYSARRIRKADGRAHTRSLRNKTGRIWHTFVPRLAGARYYAYRSMASAGRCTASTAEGVARSVSPSRSFFRRSFRAPPR